MRGIYVFGRIAAKVDLKIRLQHRKHTRRVAPPMLMLEQMAEMQQVAFRLTNSDPFFPRTSQVSWV